MMPRHSKSIAILLALMAVPFAFGQSPSIDDIDIESLFEQHVAEHQDVVLSGEWDCKLPNPSTSPLFRGISSDQSLVRFQFSFDRGLRLEVRSGEEFYSSLETNDSDKQLVEFWHEKTKKFGAIRPSTYDRIHFWPSYVQELVRRELLCTYEAKRFVPEGISFQRKFGDSGLVHEIVFDTDRGLQIKRKVVRTTFNEVEATYKNEFIDGVWIPVEIHVKTSQKQVKPMEFHLVGDAMRFSAKNQPMSWEIEFGEGVHVQNANTLEDYVVGDDRSTEQRNLDQLIQSLPAGVDQDEDALPTESKYQTRSWLTFFAYLSLPILAVMVAGWWVVRLRRRRNR